MERPVRTGNRAAELALAIYRDALKAVRADTLIHRAVSLDSEALRIGDDSYDLRTFERILVVGAGKASAGMAAALEEILGDRISDGIVVTKYGHSVPTQRIRILEAGHPIPDESSLEAGRAIHTLAESADANDLVICLLSGGASALMELPREGITLEDLCTTTDLLLKSGATINDLNAVRACLSQLKAGGLARAAHPAGVVCLAISDVLGNPLEVIGSGPCCATPVNPKAALEALGRVADRVPTAVIAFLEREKGRTPDVTKRSSDQLLAPHYILGDLGTAIRAACESSRSRGLNPAALTESLQGEGREKGQSLGLKAHDLPDTVVKSRIDCYIAGGETTVTVRGGGKGGRSQELAAAAALEMRGVPGIALLAAGTDGTDGPTDAAGALVDGDTITLAEQAGVNALELLNQNDSYPLLQAADALLFTGPTQTNVNDLAIIVHARE